jgi:hypothetical protein
MLQEKLMLRSLCNKKGVGLIEVLIAMFLTTVGIMALLSLQPTGLNTIAKSDYVGRAAGILYKTLENYETRMLNPCNIVVLGAVPEASIPASGQISAIAGDIVYKVNTTIDQVGVYPQTFVVTVKVTWTGNTTGISESMTVTRQEAFRFPVPPAVAVACVDNSQ